ncbi:MAG: UDP-N-acetylmuramate dehydrogenase [Candidatus Cloacimonetes bacterium]|nr:UDP-N-acetylmuramate dehydrogenase [Candidatus Cloacimonadota bacterium]
MACPEVLQNLLEFVPASSLSTWGIGGTVRYVSKPKNLDEVLESFKFAKERGLPILPLGNGSNLLFDDEDFLGIVIKVNADYIPMRIDGDRLFVSAGKMLASMARYARQHGCYDYDYLATIPGAVGGSIVNNAGAFGREICDRLLSVMAIEIKTQRLLNIPRSEIEFAYRKCSLRGTHLVLGAEFQFRESEDEGFSSMNLYRKSTQPLKFPSAGCVFKNPPGNSAGKIVDEAGLKNLRVGDAVVSDIHANFILNMKNATAENVKELVSLVQDRVFRETGHQLVREIQYASEAVISL